MDAIGFVLLLLAVGAFIALTRWLRSSSGELHPPSEPGDADKWPRW